MNNDIFFIVAMFLNLAMCLLYPTALGLDDPFGIDSIREQKFNELSAADQNYFIETGVFNADGTPGNNFNELKDLSESGEAGKGVTITDAGFGFLDYIKVGINAIKSLATFAIAAIVIMFKLLPSPLNILFGSLFSGGYLYTFAKLVMGR